MTQLTITVDNPNILPHLKSVLKAIEGVNIVPTRRKRKPGIEQAYDDVRAGRITRYASKEDFYKAFGL